MFNKKRQKKQKALLAKAAPQSHSKSASADIAVTAAANPSVVTESMNHTEHTLSANDVLRVPEIRSSGRALLLVMLIIQY